MQDEQSADCQTVRDDYLVDPVATAHMHFAAAFLLGAWYSIVFAVAMSAGVKFLHPGTPLAHGVLQSLAWAIGSGIAIALASRLAKTRRLAVGVSTSCVSASVWIALLFLSRDDLDQSVVEVGFGHSVSMELYLIGFSVLTLLVGLVSSLLGAASRDDDDLTGQLLAVPSRHWFWLWMAGSLWVSMLPIAAYYLWLQFATALYSIIHPFLWFREGTDLFLGFLGITALFIGIEISLKAVSDKKSFGGAVWKRVLVFLAGTLILASVFAPLLLNMDIDRMKDMPASLGSRPWWIL